MISAQAVEIGKAKADVVAIAKERDALKVDIAAGNVAISEVKAKVAALESLPATVESLTAANRALHVQVTLMETSLGKANEQTALADATASKWKLAYDAEAVVSQTWVAAYNRERALRVMADDLAKINGRRAAALKITGTVKDILIVAVGAYIGGRAAGII